jgi:hypothetical protein
MQKGFTMNAKASHFSAHVISWAEHEEAIFVALLRKLRNDVDEIEESVVLICVVSLLAYIFLSVLPQLYHYAQLNSYPNILPFLGS